MGTTLASASASIIGNPIPRIDGPLKTTGSAEYAAFLDYPDPAMSEYGARGVGEIGLAGVASAITAAVYHATGIHVRELTVRIEDLLPSKIMEA